MLSRLQSCCTNNLVLFNLRLDACLMSCNTLAFTLLYVFELMNKKVVMWLIYCAIWRGHYKKNHLRTSWETPTIHEKESIQQVVLPSEIYLMLF